MPVISVVIPTYNRCEMVSTALSSVLAQNYHDLEVIVVDDGSIDRTQEVLGNFSDNRVRVFYQENSGLAAARNAGIRQAQGTYIAFLDDDDLWLPEKIAQQVALFEQQPDLGLVICGYQTIDAQGVKLSEVRPWLWRPELSLQTWLYSCPTVPSAVMVRRDWLEKAGGFNEQISRQGLGSEDWELWLRLASLGCQMAWIKECLCAYRVHPGSMAHRASKQRQGMILTLDTFFSLLHLEIETRSQKDLVYSHAYLRGAAREYAGGLVEAAAADIELAINLNPGLLNNQGKELFNSLLGWINDPVVDDRNQYLERIFNHLPNKASVLRLRKKEAFALAARAEFFQAYRSKRSGVMLKSLGRIFRLRPGLLFDRGILAGIFFISKDLLPGARQKNKS